MIAEQLRFQLGAELDGAMTSRDLLLMKAKGNRSESVDVSHILIESSLVDENHAGKLEESMEGDWGQLNPVTLRARQDTSGQIVYDVIDGFHRSTGLKNISDKRREQINAKAIVLYGCSDNEMFDLRVLAANSVKSVKYARTIEWMRRSLESTEWRNNRISVFIEKRMITLSQIFSLTGSDTSGGKLGLRENEVLELKEWATQKAGKWGKPVNTLTVELRTAELANPELVKRVRLGGGGGEGHKGYLTLARLQAIVNEIPYDGQSNLQERIVDTIVEHNITAKEAGVLAHAIATAHALNDNEAVDNLLRDPFIILKQQNGNQEEKSHPRGIVNPAGQENRSEEVHKLIEQNKMQAALIKHQDNIIRGLEPNMKIADNLPDGNLLLAQKVGTSIVLNVEKKEILSTRDGFKVALTPIETRLLEVLIGYNVPVEMNALYLLIYDREPVMDEAIEEQLRPHISNLRNKIGQISPLLKEQLENIRGVGYQWKRTT